MKIIITYIIKETVCTDTIKVIKPKSKDVSINLFSDGRAIVKTRTGRYLYVNCQRIHVTGQLPKGIIR
jgi:hypothetical protein